MERNDRYADTSGDDLYLDGLCWLRTNPPIIPSLRVIDSDSPHVQLTKVR